LKTYLPEISDGVNEQKKRVPDSENRAKCTFSQTIAEEHPGTQNFQQPTFFHYPFICFAHETTPDYPGLVPCAASFVGRKTTID
jgi:hypothetical protein